MYNVLHFHDVKVGGGLGLRANLKRNIVFDVALLYRT